MGKLILGLLVRVVRWEALYILGNYIELGHDEGIRAVKVRLVEWLKLVLSTMTRYIES